MQEDRGVVIEDGRHALGMAFSYLEKPSESVMAYFSGQKRVTDGGGKRTRAAVHQVYAAASRPAGFSRVPLQDRQRLTGFVHRCVKELPTFEQNWIWAIYRDGEPVGFRPGSPAHKFMRDYSEWYIQTRMAGCRAGTKGTLREMVAYRMQQEWGGRPMDQPFVSLNQAISAKAWQKTHKEHWSTVRQELRRLDESALYKIGLKVLLM